MSRDKIKSTVIDVKLEDLSDGLPAYVGFEGYSLRVNDDGDGLDYGVPIPIAGSWLFTILEDVPSSYVGNANKLVKVTSGADGLEFGQTIDEIVNQKMVTANTGASYTIDLSLGIVFNLTLTDGCTFTLPATGTTDIMKQFWIYLKRDTTPNRIITWDTDIRWPMNITPALDGTASTLTIFRFSQLGNTARWYGEVLGMGYEI